MQTLVDDTTIEVVISAARVVFTVVEGDSGAGEGLSSAGVVSTFSGSGV